MARNRRRRDRSAAASAASQVEPQRIRPHLVLMCEEHARGRRQYFFEPEKPLRFSPGVLNHYTVDEIHAGLNLLITNAALTDGFIGRAQEFENHADPSARTSCSSSGRTVSWPAVSRLMHGRRRAMAPTNRRPDAAATPVTVHFVLRPELRTRSQSRFFFPTGKSVQRTDQTKLRVRPQVVHQCRLLLERRANAIGGFTCPQQEFEDHGNPNGFRLCFFETHNYIMVSLVFPTGQTD